jgi:hypothetical protein
MKCRTLSVIQLVSKITPSCRTNSTQKKKIQNTGTASKRSETSDLVDLMRRIIVPCSHRDIVTSSSTVLVVVMVRQIHS